MDQDFMIVRGKLSAYLQVFFRFEFPGIDEIIYNLDLPFYVENLPGYLPEVVGYSGYAVAFFNKKPGKGKERAVEKILPVADLFIINSVNGSCKMLSFPVHSCRGIR